MSAVPPSLTFGWRRMLLFVLIAEAAVVATFHETAAAMVDIWMRSETFNHALLVPPIAIWLIWEKRHDVVRIAPRPALWLGLPLVALAFAWLLGELAAVNAITQFALVAMVVVIVPLLIGVPAARTIAFPLGFLFFAVPFGEFVMPTLMDWTAFFTVLGVRASGIPVYQEGLHFVIPSGSWSVVEACSGVRYLIASIVVGTLYAYLSYRSLKRRLIFVGFSVLVPLVANWLRAYMIVMLGHLSGNKLAVGVDHLIYGWVFFGVVIMIMFAIGLRWREDSAPVAVGVRQTAAAAPVAGSRPMIALAMVLVVAMLPRFVLTAIDARTNKSTPILEPALLASAGWRVEEGELSTWEPRYLNPAARVTATLQKGDQRIAVTILFYRGQDKERKLISSENVLVTSNDKQWIRVASGGREVALGDRRMAVRGAQLKSQQVGDDGAPVRLAVWNWYWITGATTTSDPVGKLRIALSRLAGQGDDSAAIFLSAVQPEAEPALEAYLATAGDGIDKLLQRASGGL